MLTISEDQGVIAERYASPAPMAMEAKSVPIEALQPPRSRPALPSHSSWSSLAAVI